MYNKSTFPGYFTCGLVYRQWSFGGNRVVGLNGLPVILPRVMHISTEIAEFLVPMSLTLSHDHLFQHEVVNCVKSLGQGVRNSECFEIPWTWAGGIQQSCKILHFEHFL
jgi:hypothetical protein